MDAQILIKSRHENFSANSAAAITHAISTMTTSKDAMMLNTKNVMEHTSIVCFSTVAVKICLPWSKDNIKRT
jgi:hypothetical protein